MSIFYICHDKNDIDRYCSPYGNEFYTITKDDIEALLAGKTLAAVVNDEYGVFIKIGGNNNAEN